MKGLVHIYEGDGKGKTTAAVGLAVRCAGDGNPVIFTQFLKDNNSGEIRAMEKIPGLTVLKNTSSFGFTFQMNEQQKQEAALYYTRHFQDAVNLAKGEHAKLLVMDELLDAVNAGMVEEQEVIDFLKNRPEDMDIVITGRNPSEELEALSDYHSQVTKIRHPYDKGIAARKGIEY